MKVIIFYIDPNVSKIFVEKTDEDGNKSLALSSPNNFVYIDEIVAKIIDIDNQEEVAQHIDEGYSYHTTVKYFPLKAGDGIYYDSSTSLYKAQEYGFARFDKHKSRISLLQPLQITKEKIKVYYLVHPTKLHSIPTYENIEEVLVKRKIYSGVSKEEVEKQLNEIDINNPMIHQITVASGKDPVNGYEDYYTPLIKTEKEAGKILEDGSIDFKEVSSVVEIKKGQEILQKHPAVEPVDGYNIYGDPAKAIMEENKGYVKGENIVQSGKDEFTYVSSIDGCLETKKNTISVSPIAIINGDVDYDSGNIDFNGSVHISGSVLPGFSVKAQDNVIVGKHIEDASVEAGGAVQVKLGIGGKGSTTIMAGGKVKAKYVVNSTIEAGGVIEIGDSIINSNIFSNEKISLTAKHGKIIGGEATALYDIVVNESGVPKENKTILSVGKSLFIERSLNEIKDLIGPVEAEVEEITTKIKASFGTEVFNNTKEFISILPPVKQKNCLQLLTDLSRKNEELKILKDQEEEEKSKLRFERNPVIVIRDKVYPGTVIKIKNSVRLLDKDLQNVKFYEDQEEKVIKFTAANKAVTSG